MHTWTLLLLTCPLLLACKRGPTPDGASAPRASAASSSSSEAVSKEASAGKALRLRLLKGTPGEFGIANPGKVWAVATNAFPYPDPGQIRFYLLTPSGARTVQVAEDALVCGMHPISDLFFGMNDVFTELRVIAEAADAR